MHRQVAEVRIHGQPEQEAEDADSQADHQDGGTLNGASQKRNVQRWNFQLHFSTLSTQRERACQREQGRQQERGDAPPGGGQRGQTHYDLQPPNLEENRDSPNGTPFRYNSARGERDARREGDSPGAPPSDQASQSRRAIAAPRSCVIVTVNDGAGVIQW